MISHAEAQELHEIIGAELANADMRRTVFGAKHDLERALEIAALIVSDTDPDNAPDEPTTQEET